MTQFPAPDQATGNYIDLGDAAIRVSTPMHLIIDHGHVAYTRSPNGEVAFVKLDGGERVGYTYRDVTRSTPLDALRAAIFSPEKFKEMAEPDESVRLFSTENTSDVTTP